MQRQAYKGIAINYTFSNMGPFDMDKMRNAAPPFFIFFGGVGDG